MSRTSFAARLFNHGTRILVEAAFGEVPHMVIREGSQSTVHICSGMFGPSSGFPFREPWHEAKYNVLNYRPTPEKRLLPWPFATSLYLNKLDPNHITPRTVLIGQSQSGFNALVLAALLKGVSPEKVQNAILIGGDSLFSKLAPELPEVSRLKMLGEALRGQRCVMTTAGTPHYGIGQLNEAGKVAMYFAGFLAPGVVESLTSDVITQFYDTLGKGPHELLDMVFYGVDPRFKIDPEDAKTSAVAKAMAHSAQMALGSFLVEAPDFLTRLFSQDQGDGCLPVNMVRLRDGNVPEVAIPTNHMGLICSELAARMMMKSIKDLLPLDASDAPDSETRLIIRDQPPPGQPQSARG